MGSPVIFRLLICSTAISASLLAGCSKEPVAAYVMPKPDDITCAKASIDAMPIPEEERRKFGSQCARRGSYTNSPGKTY